MPMFHRRVSCSSWGLGTCTKRRELSTLDLLHMRFLPASEIKKKMLTLYNLNKGHTSLCSNEPSLKLHTFLSTSHSLQLKSINLYISSKCGKKQMTGTNVLKKKTLHTSFPKRCANFHIQQHTVLLTSESISIRS